MDSCTNFPCVSILEDLVNEKCKQTDKKIEMPRQERIFFELNSYLKTYKFSGELSMRIFYYKGIKKNVEEINGYLDM